MKTPPDGHYPKKIGRFLVKTTMESDWRGLGIVATLPWPHLNEHGYRRNEKSSVSRGPPIAAPGVRKKSIGQAVIRAFLRWLSREMAEQMCLPRRIDPPRDPTERCCRNRFRDTPCIILFLCSRLMKCIVGQRWHLYNR